MNHRYIYTYIDTYIHTYIYIYIYIHIMVLQSCRRWTSGMACDAVCGRSWKILVFFLRPPYFILSGFLTHQGFIGVYTLYVLFLETSEKRTFERFHRFLIKVLNLHTLPPLRKWWNCCIKNEGCYTTIFGTPPYNFGNLLKNPLGMTSTISIAIASSRWCPYLRLSNPWGLPQIIQFRLRVSVVNLLALGIQHLLETAGLGMYWDCQGLPWLL